MVGTDRTLSLREAFREQSLFGGQGVKQCACRLLSQGQTVQHQKVQVPSGWNDVYESVPRGAPMRQQIIKQFWNLFFENAVFIEEFLDDILFLPPMDQHIRPDT